MALVTKSPPANARGPRDAGSVLGREDSLRKEMEAYPSSPAWKVPRIEKPGGLQSTGSHRAGHA